MLNKHILSMFYPCFFVCFLIIVGSQWHYKHTIEARYWINACHWINQNYLAVCMVSYLAVYKVTTTSSHLAYIIRPRRRKTTSVRGVAVSESLPDTMLVILQEEAFVYQYPFEDAEKEVKKHTIEGDKIDPYNIVANATTAVVDTDTNVGKTVAIYSLPDFTHQSNIQISFVPRDLSISSDFLLVMDAKHMTVKLLGDDMSRDLGAIKPPIGWAFCCVVFSNNRREIYAGVCKEGEKQGRIYKYVRGGVGKPLYGNAGCVIDGLEKMRGKILSVTSDGLLAVAQSSFDVNVYSTPEYVGDFFAKECSLM